MTITQFQGESNWDALINSYALDIEEEASFKQFIEDKGYTTDQPLKVLKNLHQQWRLRKTGTDA